MNWKPTADKILTMAEIQAVLADLRRRSKRSVNSRMNLALFRLATCCGLRVSELTALQLADVRDDHIRLRKRTTKGKKSRIVPFFDAGTQADVLAWRDQRRASGAESTDLLLCSLSKGSTGKRLHRTNARKRFKACCRCLGPERVARLTIHHGRHSFASHAIKKVDVVRVRDACGHSSLAITDLYAHVVDASPVNDLFA
jgi:integrase